MEEHHQRHLSELVKRADDAVQRHGLEGVRAEVVLVLDVSKSMYQMYKSRAVHELATRLLALSLEFDDDGVIPAYAFGDTCRHLGDLTLKDFPTWVEKEVIRTGSDFQNSCMYAPVIHDVCSYFFPEDWHRPTSEKKTGLIFKKKSTVYPTLSAPRALPVYALFVTGGDCMDQEATTDAVRRSSRLPIFWQFVGLQPGKGPTTRFKFLEKLDNLGNTHVDNCGFFEVSDTRNDKILFDGMAREFPSYLHKPEVRAMLAAVEDGGLTTKGERGPATDARGGDTAERLAPNERGPGSDTADALERARQRREVEARAQLRRTERSRVDMPAHAPEPTQTLAPLSTRTMKAVSDTRTLQAMKETVDDHDEPVVPARARPAAGRAGPVFGGRGAATRGAGDAERTVMRQAVGDGEHTAMRPAIDGERTVMRPALDDDADLARELAQTERTSLVQARDDDDEPPRPKARPRR